MSELRWKLNRLKAMGGREAIYRCVQTLSQKVEKIRFNNGWEPVPSGKVGSNTFLLTKNGHIVQDWFSYFSLDTPALNNLLAGQIDFYGHKPLTVGDPVQWHRDPVTGIKTSTETYGKALNYRDDGLVGNVKFLWELGRHQHLVPLAVAYAVSGEQKYKDAVAGQIQDWISQNPFNSGIHWCSSLEVALRCISWSIVHSLFHLHDNDSGLFDAVDDPQTLGNSIYQHAWFVVHFLSRYSSANNHLIGELTGLWACCKIFDLGGDGKKWGLLAQNGLEVEAKKQVFPDGVNKEQAVCYHLWVLEYLLFASLVGTKSDTPFSTEFGKTIDSMAEFLDALTPSEGIPPQIGDADDGFVSRFDVCWPRRPYADVLQAVQMIRKNKQYGVVTQKAFWYGNMAGIDFNSITNNAVAYPVPRMYPRNFPNGGYGILGDEKMHLVFNAGSLGYPSIAAHGHADALSFCMAVEGKWWFVDPGTYAYHSWPEMRTYFRSTAAHNTLTIDGLNQSQIGGPFLWVRHAPVLFEGCDKDNSGKQWAAGSHTGYAGIIHHRKITYQDRSFEFYIEDTVTGKGHHYLALNFHFAPDITVQECLNNVWITARNRSRLTITCQKGWTWQEVKGTKKPISGWYSPALEEKVPAVTLQGSWDGKLPVKILTVLQVHHDG